MSDVTVPCGRLSRGRARPLDRLTMLLPLTASGVIAEDDLTAALVVLLRYAPYAVAEPQRFRALLAAALLQLSPPPSS